MSRQKNALGRKSFGSGGRELAGLSKLIGISGQAASDSPYLAMEQIVQLENSGKDGGRHNLTLAVNENRSSESSARVY